MYEWIKKIILSLLLFVITISMEMYKAIYLFLDKFIPDKRSNDDKSYDEEKYVFDRNDIFDEDSFFDDDFLGKEVDDFKDILTVFIMLAIDIIMIVILIKAETRLTNIVQGKIYMADIFKTDTLLGRKNYF